MFFLSNKDVNEIFTRLREVEKVVEVNQEHNSNLEIMFTNHDKQEMIKYDSIQDRLDKLSKFQYMAIGGFILFEFLHKMGYISF